MSPSAQFRGNIVHTGGTISSSLLTADRKRLAATGLIPNPDSMPPSWWDISTQKGDLAPTALKRPLGERLSNRTTRWSIQTVTRWNGQSHRGGPSSTHPGSCIRPAASPRPSTEILLSSHPGRVVRGTPVPFRLTFGLRTCLARRHGNRARTSHQARRRIFAEGTGAIRSSGPRIGSRGPVRTRKSDTVDTVDAIRIVRSQPGRPPNRDLA